MATNGGGEVVTMGSVTGELVGTNDDVLGMIMGVEVAGVLTGEVPIDVAGVLTGKVLVEVAGVLTGEEVLVEVAGVLTGEVLVEVAGVLTGVVLVCVLTDELPADTKLDVVVVGAV